MFSGEWYSASPASPEKSEWMTSGITKEITNLNLITFSLIEPADEVSSTIPIRFTTLREGSKKMALEKTRTDYPRKGQSRQYPDLIENYHRTCPVERYYGRSYAGD